MASQVPAPLITHLKYRPVVYRIFYFTVALCLFSLFIIFRIHYKEMVQAGPYRGTLQLILASIVPLTILLRALFFFIPRLSCQYALDSARLRITRKGKNRDVYFSQIRQVKISALSPRFLGGFSLRMDDGEKLRFLPILENSHFLLKRIADERPQLVSYSELERYLSRMELIDDSWARLRDKLLNWKTLLIKYLALPSSLSAAGLASGWTWPRELALSDRFFTLYLIVLSIFLVVGLALNHLEELYNLRHQLKMEVSKRDPEFERGTAATFNLLGALLSIVLSLLVILNFGR